MLAKAHITVGLAAAFSAVRPDSFPEMLPVITGASLGCLICDIDCENKAEKADSSRWRTLMVIIAAAALAEDHVLDAGMWRSLGSNGPYLWFFGMAGFAVLCTFAAASSHRGFSHSLLALALESLSLWLVFPQTVIPFAAAFASHVILDITNKKAVRLFYPAKGGFCLGWFYADKLANRIFAAAGSIWLTAILVILIF